MNNSIAKLLKGALLHKRNIIALIAAYAVFAFLVGEMSPAIAAAYEATFGAASIEWRDTVLMFGPTLLVYLGFSAQSFFSPKFREELTRKETVAQIKKLSEECHLGARNLKRKLEPKAQERLDNVMRESKEIVQSFMGGDKTALKVRVVTQSLKLTSNYIKLADMFRARALSADGDRVSTLAKRINKNTDNLNSVRDPGVAEELRRVIEADEKMIMSLKNERHELERIDARLQYMESTIGMLKYNIVSNLESEDILSDLESDVFEASALSSVLTERSDERRERGRVRL